MKRAVIIFTLIFFFLEIGGVYSDSEMIEYDYYEVKGGFKKCIIYNYYFENSIDSNVKNIRIINLFDEKG